MRLPSAEPTGLDIYATEIRAAEVTRWLLLLSEVRVDVRESFNAPRVCAELTVSVVSLRWFLPQGHDPDSLSSELARMTGISDFVTLSSGWEPPSAEPPAGPATPAVVYVDADVADLLDGVATASRTRSLATLANLEGIAVHHGLLDADQAQLLAHWLDTLQTAL